MKNSESKGNKASNIYQVLKGSGAWQSKDSQGPMIKGVGIKSPLNMKSPNKLMPSDLQAVKDKQQQKKNAETRKSGKAVSYKDAYADADKKKYDTYEKFEKAAKDYNKKKYETENPTSESKKQKISKEQLAKNVAEKNKKNTGEDKKVTTGKDKKVTTGEDKKVTTGEDKKVTKTDTAKKNLETTKESVKDARSEVKDTNKAKRIQKRADKRAKKAKRIKEEGGTRVGNALRGIFKKKDKKKDDSAAKMKKSPMKMKKGSPAKVKGLKKVAKKATDMAIDIHGGLVAKAFGKGDKVQSLKNKKNKALGLGVNYKEAYADADKKKYPTFASFKKDAVAYNKKKSPNKLYKKKK